MRTGTATTGTDWRQLVQDANTAAKDAGYAHIKARIDWSQEQGHPEEYLMEWLIDQLLQGPDDSWSGRGNDARRCYFEGVREAVRDYVNKIRYSREER